MHILVMQIHRNIYIGTADHQNGKINYKTVELDSKEMKSILTGRYSDKEKWKTIEDVLYDRSLKNVILLNVVSL